MSPLPETLVASGARGAYLLVLRLDREVEIEVGKLGRFVFPPGYYVYTGSALGPGGLQARVGRHLRKSKVSKWHLDYLVSHSEIESVRIAPGDAILECQWSALLRNSLGGRTVAPGFGSSDCSCPSHLVYFAGRPPLDGLGIEVAIPVLRSCTTG